MEGFNQNNGKCANRRLSQPRGSPHHGVSLLCPVPRLDQMQLQESVYGVRSHFRAGWWSASH